MKQSSEEVKAWDFDLQITIWDSLVHKYFRFFYPLFFLILINTHISVAKRIASDYRYNV
jgi:hypothetical protein